MRWERRRTTRLEKGGSTASTGTATQRAPTSASRQNKGKGGRRCPLIQGGAARPHHHSRARGRKAQPATPRRCHSTQLYGGQHDAKRLHEGAFDPAQEVVHVRRLAEEEFLGRMVGGGGGGGGRDLPRRNSGAHLGGGGVGGGGRDLPRRNSGAHWGEGGGLRRSRSKHALGPAFREGVATTGATSDTPCECGGGRRRLASLRARGQTMASPLQLLRERTAASPDPTHRCACARTHASGRMRAPSEQGLHPTWNTTTNTSCTSLASVHRTQYWSFTRDVCPDRSSSSTVRIRSSTGSPWWGGGAGRAPHQPQAPPPQGGEWRTLQLARAGSHPLRVRAAGPGPRH
jgi:hypothetical protein